MLLLFLVTHQMKQPAQAPNKWQTGTGTCIIKHNYHQQQHHHHCLTLCSRPPSFPPPDLAAAAGFHLTLKRLVLRNATLTPPYQGSATPHVPRLLPLGLFDAVPRNLTLLDVRLVVQESEFQQYLEFFAKQLRAGGPDAVAGPSMHTVSGRLCAVPVCLGQRCSTPGRLSYQPSSSLVPARKAVETTLVVVASLCWLTSRLAASRPGMCATVRG